jgi:hypothetical protein
MAGCLPWHREEQPVSRTAVDPTAIAVCIDGGIVSEVADYARVKIAQALTNAPGVPNTAVRLRHGTDQEHRVIATASVAIDGHCLHARVAAPSEWRAVDLLADRIRRRVPYR